jgi:hypothetical protein
MDTEQKPEQILNEMITVFELEMHDSKIIDTLKSNLLGMIEVELENLENDEFDVLKIKIRRKKMTQTEYENTPEFEGY